MSNYINFRYKKNSVINITKKTAYSLKKFEKKTKQYNLKKQEGIENK